MIQEMQAEYEEAAELYERALSLGTVERDLLSVVLDALNDLGCLCNRQGKREEVPAGPWSTDMWGPRATWR